jgi:glycosyltransferase involved in cell wall biosynthesis
MDTISKKNNKQLADNLDIKLHGKIYQRNRFYQKLADNDMLVMPSFAEKQGKVQLEAMSAGVVPICSDSGGTHRTIDNFHNGLLFPPGNSQQLAEKIQSLYGDKYLYNHLQKNGLDFIENLSLEDQVAKMSEITKNFFANKND